MGPTAVHFAGQRPTKRATLVGAPTYELICLYQGGLLVPFYSLDCSLLLSRFAVTLRLSSLTSRGRCEPAMSVLVSERLSFETGSSQLVPSLPHEEEALNSGAQSEGNVPTSLSWGAGSGLGTRWEAVAAVWAAGMGVLSHGGVVRAVHGGAIY